MNKVISVNSYPYRVIKLLGKGKGGYSYLVADGDRQYVLKQIHHEPCDYYKFGNKIQSELDDYAKLKDTGIKLPKLIEADVVGERILKAYIDGKTADAQIKRNALPKYALNQVRTMSKTLRPLGLNIDWYPTNFVLCGKTLYYIDYECNKFSEEWSFENWGIKYWK